ncbi:MAG: ABC transporter permease [Vicinamibacterales bacterium]
MRNLRLAFRTLARTPFVSLVAVVSLALGIGANSAIFSLFDQLLLRPLPVPRPGELVNFGAPGPKRGSTSCNQAGSCDEIFSYPMFRDLERVQTSFTGIAAHRIFGANVAYDGNTESVDGVIVSGSYFPVLGIQAAIGRLFTPEDDRTPGGHPVAVLSHDYWRRRFQEDPGILDQTLIVNGQALTVIGVAPRGFEGTTLGAQPAVFVPLTMRGEMEQAFREPGFENRRQYWAYLFARLAPGVSIDQARVALNGPYRAIINDVEAPLQNGLSDQTMAQFRAKTITLEPGSRGQSDVRREARAPLTILFAVTGTVLLIACANIANLLLARGAGRSAEMAVRLSIGASRWQLVRQLLTESVLLAVLGAVLGMPGRQVDARPGSPPSHPRKRRNWWHSRSIRRCCSSRRRWPCRPASSSASSRRCTAPSRNWRPRSRTRPASRPAPGPPSASVRWPRRRSVCPWRCSCRQGSSSRASSPTSAGSTSA